MSGSASPWRDADAFPAGFRPLPRRDAESTDWEELEDPEAGLPDGDQLWGAGQRIAGRRARSGGAVLDEAPVAVPAEVVVLPLAGVLAPRSARPDAHARAAAPLPRPTRVAVLGARGGAGRTTVTALLGLTLAALRSGPVTAVDAVPDFGALAARLAGTRVGQGRRPEVRSAAVGPGLAGAADGIGTLLGLDGLVLVDGPAGVRHEPLPTVIGAAELLVLVVAPDRWGGHPDLGLLDWLDVNGHARRVRGAVAVVAERGADGTVLDAIEAHLTQRCLRALRLPHDEHLAEGGPIDEARLDERTALACLELAAAAVDALAAGSWTDPAAEELVAEVQLAAATVPGYLGARVEEPVAERPGWRVTLAFAGQEELDAWRASAARARCYAEAAALSPPRR